MRYIDWKGIEEPIYTHFKTVYSWTMIRKYNYISALNNCICKTKSYVVTLGSHYKINDEDDDDDDDDEEEEEEEDNAWWRIW